MEALVVGHDRLLLFRLQVFRNVDLQNQALLDLFSQCECRQLDAANVQIDK